MSIYKEQMEEIISSWTSEQLAEYITKLEERVVATQKWLRELKEMQRLKKRTLKKPVDTGARDGR